jgi:uncharacterized protein YecT (DUF1311 family)
MTAVPALPAAAVATADAAYAACMAKATSTHDMQLCQRAGRAAADARVAAAYADALGALPPDQQAKLRESQRRWTAFRSQDCSVFFGKETGTAATVTAGGCMIDRAEDRIKDLRGFIDK